MNLSHGDPVRFTETLRRTAEWRNRESGYGTRTWKVWQRQSGKERHGLFLGWRTVRDGIREWGDEFGPVFIPKGEPSRVALVSYSATRNPVYVPYDNITPTGGPQDA